MKEVKLGERINSPIALALGFFDSLHIGHRKILKNTIEYARANNCLSAVITFDNNPFVVLDQDIKIVYNYSERKKLLKALGIDIIIKITFNTKTMNLSPDEFMSRLFVNDIKKIFCGQDYSYGHLGSGNVTTLEKNCADKNCVLEIVPEIEYFDLKASSTLVRSFLSSGDMENANRLLVVPYRVGGKIVRGRGVGNHIGFPTINFDIKDEILLAKGVYKTITLINGTVYNSVTNVGAKPTFADSTLSIESYVVGLEGNYYNKTAMVYFMHFIRDIIKFNSVEQLTTQINDDLEKAGLK